MILFHKRAEAQKTYNDSTDVKYYTLPSVSGILATEEDVASNILVSMIEKPSIISPLSGSTNYNNVIGYTPYKNNPLYTGSKTHIEIQVALDENFTNIISSNKISDTNQNTVTSNLSIDYSNTTAFIRIRYYSNLYSSPWSDPISVTTKTFEVKTPRILTPINNTEIYPNVVVSTSGFEYVGISDTHDSTTYQASLDANFINIIYNVTSKDLLSHIMELEDGKTYYIRVRHNGKKYGSSWWSDTVKINTVKFEVLKPTIVTPINNSANIIPNITIGTSKFSYIGYSEVHASTTYQVATDAGFTNITHNVTSTTNLLSQLITVGDGKTYYIRVRHNGQNYGSSPWSNTVKVSTIKFLVKTPSILSPANNATNLQANVVINTSAFEYQGLYDSHASTTYQVATDVNFSNLVYNVTTTQLTSHMVTLGEGATYYIRVRFNGVNYGSSDFSSVIRITTEVPVKLYGGKYHTENHANTLVSIIFNNNGTVTAVNSRKWFAHTGLFLDNPKNIKLFYKILSKTNVRNGQYWNIPIGQTGEFPLTFNNLKSNGKQPYVIVAIEVFDSSNSLGTCNLDICHWD